MDKWDYIFIANNLLLFALGIGAHYWGTALVLGVLLTVAINIILLIKFPYR